LIVPNVKQRNNISCRTFILSINWNLKTTTVSDEKLYSFRYGSSSF